MFESRPGSTRVTTSAPRLHHVAMVDIFKLKIPMPPKGTCDLRFKPLLGESEPVVVKYKVPFGLNVESDRGQAVCTKDGPGGEKVGDILRYCTQWTLGLPEGDGASMLRASKLRPMRGLQTSNEGPPNLPSRTRLCVESCRQQSRPPPPLLAPYRGSSGCLTSPRLAALMMSSKRLFQTQKTGRRK